MIVKPLALARFLFHGRQEGPDMTRFFGRRSIVTAMALLVLAPFGAAVAQGRAPLNEVNPRVAFSSVSRAYSGSAPAGGGMTL